MVDGQTLFRTGLAVLLADLPAVVVVSQARNSAELFSEALTHELDLLFIDLQLPWLHARPQLHAIRRLLPQARTVLLMNEWDRQQVRLGRELAVDGVLLRSAGRAQLEATLGAVRRGQRLPQLPPSDCSDSPARLTQRELQILQQMALGLSNLRIAREMRLALPTAKFHVANVLGKLGVDNRTAAVVTALRQGLVQEACGQAMPAS